MLSAHEVPDEKKTPQQVELAAPLVKALKALDKDWEDRMTPEEKEEKKRLLEEMGKLVVLLPEVDASHLVNFDGLYDVPKASVLGSSGDRADPRSPRLGPRASWAAGWIG